MECEEVGEIQAAAVRNSGDRACSRSAFTCTHSQIIEDAIVRGEHRLCPAGDTPWRAGTLAARADRSVSLGECICWPALR